MKTLDNFLDEYLRIRRKFGYQLESQEKKLKNFLMFLKKEKSSIISSKMSFKWASHSGKATRANTAQRLSIVRQFASYVSVEDPRHEVPPVDLVPYPRSGRKMVYIYSSKEVSDLMEATRVAFCNPMTSQNYYILIGLLATTGMRIGEILNLNLEDFNSKEKYLLVKRSKDGQSRRVLLHKSTIEKIQSYLKVRSQFPKASTALLATYNGTRIHRANVHRNFDKVLRTAGLYKKNPKPRVHDLRHTFIVRTFERWYCEGLNVEANLSHLSTYVGHANPSSTYWYLQSTPELMAYVTEKLNKRMKELS